MFRVPRPSPRALSTGPRDGGEHCGAGGRGPRLQLRLLASCAGPSLPPRWERAALPLRGRPALWRHARPWGCSTAEPTERVLRHPRARQVRGRDSRGAERRGGAPRQPRTARGTERRAGVSGRTSFPVRAQNCLQARSEPRRASISGSSGVGGGAFFLWVQGTPRLLRSMRGVFSIIEYRRHLSWFKCEGHSVAA